MLMLKVKDQSLYPLQVYTFKTENEYQAFVDDVNEAFRSLGSTEFTIFLENFLRTHCRTQ